MIVTSVQIKTVKTQKHLYCPVFTNIRTAAMAGIGLPQKLFFCGNPFQLNKTP